MLEHEWRFKIILKWNVLNLAIEGFHVRLKLHRPAASIYPVQTRAPIEISLAVIINEGLGIDHVITGLIVLRYERLVAKQVVPGTERFLRDTGPDFVAD